MSPTVMAPCTASTAAGHRHAHVAQVAHEVHDGLHQAREELALPSGFRRVARWSCRTSPTTACSRLNARTTVWPEKVSSTWPLMAPSMRLLGPEVLLRVLYHHGDDEHQGHGQDEHGDATVSSGLMVSIMISTPTMVVAEVMSWVTPWFRLWPKRVHVVGDAARARRPWSCARSSPWASGRSSRAMSRRSP